MDYERPHRGGSSSSELFICFTSRPSTNYSSMKISSSKSIRSPGHGGDKSHEPTLTLSSSLKSRRLRNGSIRNGQFSPMFPSSKKRGCSFETPEPSSPKVTCIGQVRVKTKKQGKKMLARTKRKTDPKTQDGVLQKRQQHSCLPHRNQKWGYFPFTICEALRSFGADLSCFLPCGSRSLCSSAMGEKEKEEQRRGVITGENVEPRTSCGPIFERWLMALQEGEVEVEDKMRREDTEMMLAEEEEEEGMKFWKKGMEMEEVGKVGAQEDGDEPKRVSIRLPFGDADDPKRVSFCIPFKDADDPNKRLSVCLPPRNALLLMRCRSDPLKMSSLASRFWDSPLTKSEDDGGDEYDEDDDSEEDEEEEEEEMNLELEEKHEVEEVLEEWYADKNELNSGDAATKDEHVNSVEVDHQSEELGGGGEEKDFKQNGSSSSEAGVNPSIEAEPMLQQEDEVVKLNIEIVEEPKTEEEPMWEEVPEEDQDVGHNSESVENPSLEKELMLLEVQEEDQEVEQIAEAAEHCSIEEDPRLQELLEEHKEVEHNTRAVENPRMEEEPMFQEVLEKVEHNSAEAVENPIIVEEPILQEMVIGITEEVDEKDATARSSEFCVQPEREEELEPALVAEEQEGEEEAVLDLEDQRVERSSSIEEKGCEDREGLLRVDEEIESTQKKLAITMVKKQQEEKIHGDYDDVDDESGEEESSTEGSEGQRKVVVLPDCIMWMMMCEPKLSMEVSKETWVCNKDFMRRSWPDNNPRLPQLITNNEATDDVPQQQQQYPLSKSSCAINQNPTRKVVLSMASMIEQKLVKAVAYEPLVLMRCKSEPLRSSSRLVSSRVMNCDHV